MIERDVYGLYADSWNGEICPDAFALRLLSASVTCDNVTASRASLISSFLDRTTTNHAYLIWKRLFSTRYTCFLTAIIDGVFHAAYRTNGRLLSSDVSCFSTGRRALLTTIDRVAGSVSEKGNPAGRASVIDPTNKRGFVTTATKLIDHRIRYEFPANLHCAFDRLRRYTNVRVLAVIIDCYRKPEVLPDTDCKTLVIFKRKLLSGNGNPRLIPTPIITDQARQCYGVNHEIGYLVRDNLATVGVKMLCYIRKAWRGHRMEAAPPSGFAVSFVGISADLNRPRIRLEPSPFLIKPIGLFFGVVARKMIVGSVGWFTSRHISQHRTYGNLKLKFAQ